MTDKFMYQSGALFTLRLKKCVCLVDLTHTDKGFERHTLRISDSTDDEQDVPDHLYAYASQQGLVEINQKTGSPIQGKNLTERFLSLDLEDIDQLVAFIREFGSFVSFPADGFCSIDHEDIYAILRRLQIVVSMITNLNSQKHDFLALCNHMLRLNFGRYHKIELVENSDFIETCKHPITELWYDRDSKEIATYMDPVMASLPSYILEDEWVFREINDRFRKKKISTHPDDHKFDFEEYMSGGDIANDLSASAEVKLRSFYLSYYPFDENTRLLIDFLYYLIEQEGTHSLVWERGALQLSSAMLFDDSIDTFFTDRYKEVILQLSRVAIKEEFDAALKQVHPIFNADEMMPQWSIPNLYTALVFSIFYTDPKYEIYRQCARPGCNVVFSVSTTNMRKKYCSTACQNVAAQARHRLKTR